MAQKRIGLWLIGAKGGVATTVMTGLAALARGLVEPIGLITETKDFHSLNLIDWNDIVICAKTTEELIQKVHDWTENRDLIEVQKRCREVWETYLHFPKFLEFLPICIKKSMQ